MKLRNFPQRFAPNVLGELFGLSSSQAGRLIREMSPMLHGNSLVVDAQDIRKLLSEMEQDHEIRDRIQPDAY
jgi:hypothetical protein